jgi:hypothetical protein
VNEPDALLLDLALGSGLDESTDDAFTPATKLRVCRNAVFPDANTVAKRHGVTSLGSVQNGQRLIAHDSEVLVIDGLQAQAYLPSQASFASRGPVSQCMASRKLLASANQNASTGQAFLSPVVPLGSHALDPITGLHVYAWCDGAGVNVSIYDDVNSSYVQQGIALDPATTTTATMGQEITRPRVVIVGSIALVFYWTHAQGNLQFRAINLANILGGWSIANQAAAIPVDSTCLFDACSVNAVDGGGAPAIALSVAIASGTNKNVKLIVATVSGTTISQVGAVAVVDTIAGGTVLVTTVAIAATAPSETPNDRLGVLYGYSQNPNPELYVLRLANVTPTRFVSPVVNNVSTLITDTDPGGTTTMAPHMFVGAALVRDQGGSGNTAGWVYTFTRTYTQLYTTAGHTGSQPIAAFYFAQTDAPVSICGPFLGWQTVSRPFKMTVAGSTNFYVLAMFIDGLRAFNYEFGNDLPNAVPSGAQTLALLQVTPFGGGATPWAQPVPIATIATRFAGDPYPGASDVVPLLSRLGFTCIGTEKDAFNSTSLDAITFDFGHPGLWQTVRLGDWTYIAGGLPMTYDGSDLYEAGFIHQPPTPIIALGAVTGSVFNIPKIANFQVVAVYSQQDKNGNIHRSPPSNAVLIDASAGYSSAVVGVVPCAVTLRQKAGATSGIIQPNPIRIELYGNSVAAPGVFGLIAIFPNDQTASSMALTITTGGSSPFLYTTGGGVPSDGPPNLSALAIHADRVFGVSEDGRTAYFTTQLVRGEAPRWTDAFTVTWPVGPITMQWSLEQRLHAATSTGIDYLFGEGPNDNGAGSDFTSPSKWQDHIGVIDPRGFALYEGGAIFWSQKGLYHEDRSGQYTWLGERVQRTLGVTNHIVTSIVPLDTQGVVRIGCRASTSTVDGSNTGAVIHWDYRHDRFSVHDAFQLTIAGLGSLSAVNAGGAWYGFYQRTTGGGSSTYSLAREDATTYLDDGTWVTLASSPGWLHPTGMQGFARLRLVVVLGTQNTPMQLSVQVARDYEAGYDAALTSWSDTDLSGQTVFQLQATANTQKAEAFSFLVEDGPPAILSTGTGQGATLKTITARLRAKRGEYKQLSAGSRR